MEKKYIWKTNLENQFGKPIRKNLIRCIYN